MTGPLSPQELAAVDDVSTGLGLCFVTAGALAISSFAEDDRVTARALQLGIAQAHIDGLASALSAFDALQRDRLIDTLPAQIRQAMARGKQ